MLIQDIKSFLASMRYFLKLIFIGKEYDVVFVSTTAFNRGKNGKNFFFKPMIECCKKNGLSYVVFEDTSFRSFVDYKINKNSIPFDFISVIQIIFRKIYHIRNKGFETSDKVYFRELKISKFIKKLFFKKFHSKVYITLIWNNVTLWRCINPNSCVVDYQHAFIYDGEEYYMKDGRPPRLKSDNNVVALVHGDWYKNLLIDADKSGFYNKNNVITVGLNKASNPSQKKSFNNKKILFTLQLTPDFLDKKVNKRYVEIVKKIIDTNAEFLSKNNYEIIFKHHPRYNRHDCPDIYIEHDFVRFESKKPLSDLLNSVSLHMTLHSSSTFDAATISIPTIFIDMLEEISPNEMFLEQYEYPCKDLVIKDYNDLKKILTNIDNNEAYKACCDDVHQWSKDFYHDFDETVFQNFLLDQISKYKHQNGDELHQNK